MTANQIEAIEKCDKQLKGLEEMMTEIHKSALELKGTKVKLPHKNEKGEPIVHGTNCIIDQRSKDIQYLVGIYRSVL